MLHLAAQLRRIVDNAESRAAVAAALAEAGDQRDRSLAGQEDQLAADGQPGRAGGGLDDADQQQGEPSEEER
ncbi:hypothetical protein [Kitasatospora sp. NPDC050543]|uniref:hypothetical protein n=1 Tax=Kitasatospora sp. NPDC050543 TaxID=3364054 RepID=UPI00379A356A